MFQVVTKGLAQGPMSYTRTLRMPTLGARGVSHNEPTVQPTGDL
jgi:hypothetical protein